MLTKIISYLRQDRLASETIRQLSALSDRELNDIGIGRGDIRNVARGDETLERIRRQENPNLKGWV